MWLVIIVNYYWKSNVRVKQSQLKMLKEIRLLLVDVYCMIIDYIWINIVWWKVFIISSKFITVKVLFKMKTIAYYCALLQMLSEDTYRCWLPPKLYMTVFLKPPISSLKIVNKRFVLIAKTETDWVFLTNQKLKLSVSNDILTITCKTTVNISVIEFFHHIKYDFFKLSLHSMIT